MVPQPFHRSATDIQQFPTSQSRGVIPVWVRFSSIDGVLFAKLPIRLLQLGRSNLALAPSDVKQKTTPPLLNSIPTSSDTMQLRKRAFLGNSYITQPTLDPHKKTRKKPCTRPIIHPSTFLHHVLTPESPIYNWILSNPNIFLVRYRYLDAGVFHPPLHHCIQAGPSPSRTNSIGLLRTAQSH